MRRMLAILLALTMLFSASAVGLSVHAEEAAVTEKDRMSVEVGNVRVQLLSDTLARVELKGPKGYEDRETYHVVGRDWEGTPYTVSTVGDLTAIATASYTVYVPLEADSLDGIYMTDVAGKVIWSYTTLPEEPDYLPDPGDTPKAWAIADTPRVVPAEWGYAPLPAGETDNGFNGWDVDNDAPDMYIFVPLNDAKQLRKDFITLTGSSEMVPLKALGLWYSCFRAFSEQGALDYVETYREKGFPLDYFVMDTDWRVGGSHGYNVNTSLLPDIERFFDRMHEEANVNVVFNDHPEPQNGQHALQQGELIFRNENLGKLLEWGLDTWWFDRNWTVSIKTPFEGIPKESFGMYLYHDITSRITPNERAMVLSNSNGIDNGNFNFASDYASHRYSVHWTGDIGQMSNTLSKEIANSVRSGAISASPYVAPDVGGHYGMQSNEIFIRWSQFAAFAPIFRYHSVGSGVDRSPWLYGETAEETAREYIAMRYRLMPVYYALAHENYETGLPLLRRLDFNYPQYAESQDDSQYTLGDNILVAPIAEGGKEQPLPGEWMRADGKQGLKVEYYNNTNLTGTPVYTGYEDEVYHFWDYGNPGHGVNSDNFSARWTGTITLGDEDARIAVRTDDGIRVWIDGVRVIDIWSGINNTTNVAPILLEAGSTHDIKIEYYEGTGGARMELSAITIPEEGDSREVFIPDGEWIDVWTGETYTGPQTITQHHGYDSSPLFVRAGTILPLVDNVEYLGEKAWNEVTLDVYPGKQLSDTAELYEDDNTSVEYKEGAYRTTDLSTAFDEATGEVVIKVGKAVGEFEGSDAFDSRNWTFRVHAPEGWGEMTGVTVDGKKINAEKTAKSANADPFAISGGALDSDVYTLIVTKDLDEETEVRVKFATPKDEVLPEAKDVTVDMDSKEMSTPANVDLDTLGTADWAYFGVNKPVQKGDVIGDVTVEGVTYTGNTTFTYGGKTGKAGTAVADTATWTIPVDRSEQRISVYLAGEDADAALEVTGGNSAKVVKIESNGSFAKRVVLDVSAEEAVDLQFKLKANSGTVALMAIAVGDPAAEPDTSISRIVTIADAQAGINLTTVGSKDWVHLGLNGDTNAINRKNNVDKLLSAPSFTGGKMPVHDYPAVSFSDGTPTATANNSPNAITAYQGSISFSVPSSAKWQELRIYTGAYESTNTVKIYDEDGIVTTETFSATATQRKVITVKFRSDSDSTLYVESSGTGHMFVAAYTLADLDDSVLNAQVKLAEDALSGFEAAANTTAADVLGAVTGALTDDTVGAAWTEPARVTPATADSEGKISGKIRLEKDGIYLDVPVNVTLPKAAAYEMGDVDQSGVVDVADIMKLKALIMADKWSEEELAIGDMDGSKALDVGDIMAVKNIIMSK